MIVRRKLDDSVILLDPDPVSGMRPILLISIALCISVLVYIIGLSGVASRDPGPSGPLVKTEQTEMRR